MTEKEIIEKIENECFEANRHIANICALADVLAHERVGMYNATIRVQQQLTNILQIMGQLKAKNER